MAEGAFGTIPTLSSVAPTSSSTRFPSLRVNEKAPVMRSSTLRSSADFSAFTFADAGTVTATVEPQAQCSNLA